MRFKAVIGARDRDEHPGVLYYLADERSFAVQPAPTPFTSVVLGYLNFEITQSGKIVSVWGLSGNWQEAALLIPVATPGQVFIECDEPFKAGASIPIVSDDTIITSSVDRRRGWVRVGQFGEPDIAVNVTDGITIEIDKRGGFCSLWLHPENGLPDY